MQFHDELQDGAWCDYDEVTIKGTVYRSFKGGLPGRLAALSVVGFPSDGSQAINLRSKKLLGAGAAGYPRAKISKGTPPAVVDSVIKLHVAIAWLWGAPKHPKARELPMSGELVVDHIVEGDKYDWRVENLQFTTQAHNVQKAKAHKKAKKT